MGFNSGFKGSIKTAVKGSKDHHRPAAMLCSSHVWCFYLVKNPPTLGSLRAQ